jgi:hypothetical protein
MVKGKEKKKAPSQPTKAGKMADTGTFTAFFIIANIISTIVILFIITIITVIKSQVLVLVPVLVKVLVRVWISFRWTKWTNLRTKTRIWVALGYIRLILFNCNF